eukprot:CAMPEP_0113622700 /NCGR_PEP_ID=MMETSP0017_2-20120614/11646_1 /TAXON_ID=2856 /ORGANISM="Cylindrotheca closterium" /LENGTH=144 /DNA_ID=CAMNT_0000532565 /DNA_START=75 /DNA_END=509 /DNA_ORIENTATION=+ /assembly_acc=CAM_ASM_000147
MKLSFATILSTLAVLASTTEAFAPQPTSFRAAASSSALNAKYNSMDEILALFPEELPILINFYDATTEDAIKSDILTTKAMLKERATMVNIKQQDYPELAKLWDCDSKSPSMILFKDGNPVKRVYEKIDYLDIIPEISQYTQGD